MNIFNNLLFQYYIGKLKKEIESTKKLSGKIKKIKNILEKKYGEDPKNATKAGLIGTIVEEGSHVIGKVEGRQRKTGTDEKGLESTGRASNEYFSEKYKDDNPAISIHSDGKDYSNVDFGENVGDAFLFKRLVKMEYSVYYKYAKTTLKSLNNDVDKLLKLYGVTEKETLSVVKANELRGFYADAAESALVGQLTGGSTLWVKITIGTLYFFSSRNDSVSSVALSNEVKEKNALIYVAAIEEDRKGLAEKTYYGEHNSLYPFYYNYSRGKLPTQTELNKYNKVKHSNYSMQQIKTRLWKLFNYQKTRNPDYYVKPRRVELLPEIKNLWESGK